MATRPLLTRLHRDHVRFARVLDALVDRAHDFDQQAGGMELDVLANLVDYVREYPDTVHHPLEDRLFDQLIAKDVAERDVVQANVQEHQELLQATDSLAADIEAVLSGDDDRAGLLRTHVDHYVGQQRRHMGREEAVLFPLAERHFTDEDWHALEQAEERVHDPLFDERAARFESVYDYIVQPHDDERDEPSPFNRQPIVDLPPPAAVPRALASVRKVAEDAVGLAGQEVAEEIGTWFGLAERLADVQRRQFELWAEDTRAAMDRLAAQQPPGLAWLEYTQRRLAHQLEGQRETFDAWTAAAQKAVDAQRFFGAMERQRPGGA